MIKIIITKKNKQFEKIVIKGHANYSDYGKDIVCAAVSSIVTTTINACLSLNSSSLTYVTGKNVIIQNFCHDEVTTKIIDNMIRMLKELMECYPKNINLESREN